MKKAISAIACITLLSSLLCSCVKNTTADDDGKSKTDSVSLSVWTTSDMAEKTKQLTEEFKLDDVSKQWDITVKGVDDAKTEMVNDPSKTPDIFCFSSEDFDELYKSGILCKIGSDEVSAKIRNSAQSVKVASTDDDLYAYPVSVETLVMYYDKSVFNEDEVKQLESILFKDLGEGKTNISFDMASSDVLTSFFITAGCKLYGEDGNDTSVCDFNSENGQAAANYLSDLSSNEKFSNLDEEKIISSFSSGELGAAYMSSEKYEDVKKALGDNFGVTVLPKITINSKEVKMKSVSRYTMYAVNAQSDNVEAAMELADYLSSQKGQETMISINVSPTNMALCAKEELFDKNDMVKSVVKQADTSIHEPTVKKIAEYKTSISDFGKRIADKTYTKDNIKQKLDDLVKNVTD